MHSRDPNKSDAEFQTEFERILKEAGKGIADFTKFVFPSADYGERDFAAQCVFRRAMFTQYAVFADATFTQGADFSGAKFTQEAYFRAAKFTRDADFTRARFTQDADFSEAKFTQKAYFIEAELTQDAYFSEAKFTRDANFSGATFTQWANFREAKFAQGANFSWATFTQDADFRGATFTRDANFSAATFTQKAPFERTNFRQLANFTGASFLGSMAFSETQFRHDPKGQDNQPGPVFTRARFEKPEAVEFYQTYLGQALFHLCDVSRVVFSAVTWRERERFVLFKWWKRKGTGNRMVFEEEVDLKSDAAAALKPQQDDANPREYRLIQQLYQRLKKNYEEARDYSTAGHFHYGEMEMKRLSSARKNATIRWLHQRLRLVALYGYASDYGESTGRPALWLVVVLLLFGLAYPAMGLRYDTGKDPSRAASSAPAASTSQRGSAVSQQAPGDTVLKYRTPFLPDDGDRGHPWRARGRLAWHSLWASVFVALFQKDLVYEPVYLVGRAFAVFEQALTSTLFALFLLAVRRQFRR